MPDLDPIHRDLTPSPQGAAVYGKPSWLHAHVLLVAVLTGVALVLFAIFAIHR
jgi:hypothetical protein